MWPAIAGVLFVIVVVLGAYLWLQPEAEQPATVVYQDEWWPWYGWDGGVWYGPSSSSTGWWPWVPNRYPHRRPTPHHPPHQGHGWPRPHMLGPGGLAPHGGLGARAPSGGPGARAPRLRAGGMAHHKV
jgi:hypothetical protein